jgi:hypothetical protein
MKGVPKKNEAATGQQPHVRCIRNILQGHQGHDEGARIVVRAIAVLAIREIESRVLQDTDVVCH